MNRLNIALLAGGNSSERGIALQSARQIYEALDKDKYDIKVVDVHGRDWEYESPDGKRYPLDKNDFSLTVNGERTEFDYALIIIHGTPGEDGKLQGYLDIMGIPYSSCSATSSVITFDKISTKRAVASRGIRVAKDMLLYKGDSADADEIVSRLGLPLFVKPNASGSSFGVTKVRSKEDIAKAVADAFAESEEVLIEEFIEGREMACGVMIAGGKEYLFPVTEVISKNDFFDYEAKYTAGMSDEITPADITPELKAELNKMTLEAYKVCRCRGVVRIDFIVASDGRPCLIEVNAIPGMSSGSIVPKQARAMGMSLGQLFDTVIADTCGKSDDAI